MSGHESLEVALGARSYEILVGEGLLAAAGRFIRPLLRHDRVMVVTDENVAAHYLAALERALDNEAIGYEAFVLPPGEATKDFGHLEMLIDRLLAAGIERRTLLVALGGGVIGDLTGFAASILLRGLDFVQIPTTLLAQVDSSVGGKTGIDTRHGKNLVGSFHQPRLVLADTETLSSLPPRELLAGYAEVAKYGLINDPDFFGWLESHGTKIIEGDSGARRHAVLTSCRAKAAVVAADEHETAQRALLNLGHTFGHALEAALGFRGDLLHGEAVAIGMVLAFELSTEMGLCPAEDTARVRRHLAAVGLPTGLESLHGHAITAPALLNHMCRDKKVTEGRITFVLTRGIGRAFLSRKVDIAKVEVLLNSALAT
ncbi:MAG: 3-dehydroquinate synthase [Rhodospirillales bacterium]|nr:3-dehydroquinate synthase [Rhodospirillales bacterium]